MYRDSLGVEWGTLSGGVADGGAWDWGGDTCVDVVDGDGWCRRSIGASVRSRVGTSSGAVGPRRVVSLGVGSVSTPW